MLYWMEAQSPLGMALLVFGFCYLLALGTFILFAILPEYFTSGLKAASPVTLTPLAVLLGLLIAFLASRVWANLDHAGAYVGQEASSIQKPFYSLQPCHRRYKPACGKPLGITFASLRKKIGQR